MSHMGKRKIAQTYWSSSNMVDVKYKVFPTNLTSQIAFHMSKYKQAEQPLQSFDKKILFIS